MLAMFYVSMPEWVLIAASLGVLVMTISFAVSLIRPNRPPRRGLKFPVLVAIVGGGLLASLIGTRTVVRQPDVVSTPASDVGVAQNVSDPTLETLWDKLTQSKIDLGADAEELAADPTDEKAKEVVKDTFGLDDEGKLPPKWVITPPKRVGHVYRESIASDPWATEEECRRQLEQQQLPQAVARRIEQVVAGQVGHPVKMEIPVPPGYEQEIPPPPGYGQESVSAVVSREVRVANPLALGIGLDYILREICRDEFTATVDSSVGDMKKVHVLLEFDENIDKHLADAWLRHERQNRFASVSKIAALSLTGLAAIYGLLRFDTWSKGYYSGRLLVGGTLAIIALVVFVLKT